MTTVSYGSVSSSISIERKLSDNTVLSIGFRPLFHGEDLSDMSIFASIKIILSKTAFVEFITRFGLANLSLEFIFHRWGQDFKLPISLLGYNRITFSISSLVCGVALLVYRFLIKRLYDKSKLEYVMLSNTSSEYYVENWRLSGKPYLINVGKLYNGKRA